MYKKTKILNKHTFLLLAFILLFINFLCLFANEKAYASEKSNNYTSEIVMELNTKRILHQKNSKDKKYMASTTKILTAIVIIENCDINETVTITKDTIGIEGSSIYLEEGEKLTVKELLYGLMLRSGNDCAVTLAVHCSGSVDTFASLMNETAKRVGANDSNFTNPHGLHDDNHYTTAYDLALISCYAMKNEIFREIVGKKSVIIPHITRNYDRKLVNKNKILFDFEGGNGIKTGFTKKAGRCLVSSCYRDGLELICVVLNCPPMFERSKELLSNCFNNYKNYKIVESDNILGFVKIKDSNEKCAICIKNDIELPLTKSEYKNLKIIYNYDKIIEKPKENFVDNGFVEIYLENNLIFKEKIYTILILK